MKEKTYNQHNTKRKLLNFRDLCQSSNFHKKCWIHEIRES